jgi:outer membrane lipoprotein SlyB
MRFTHKEHTMEATQASHASIAAPQTHPLLLVAAASVTILSLAGVGVLAGWLPGPGARTADPVKLATATAPAPISIQQTVTVPKEQAKPASKPAERTPSVARRTEYAPTYTRSSSRQEPAPEYAVAPAPIYLASSQRQAICADCGVVEAVREVPLEAKGSGGGAVAGGLVGGLIGNQMGRGATRDIATVLGAVGGAFAGNHLEKTVKESKRYDVVVRFDDGSTRTFSSDTPPAWHSGDPVRLQNGLLIMGGGSTNGGVGRI